MTLQISPHGQDGLSIEKRSADMKTSLAIVLATIALTFGAMLSFTSGVAAHDYGNLSGKSPGAYNPVPVIIAPGPTPGPYRGQM
jgi:hypothetical protein